MKPLLQLALDFVDVEVSINILNKIINDIDIIEVGTPMIKRYGINVVRQFVELYPNKLIFADLKTVDSGEWEANLAFAAGAHMISVLGCANNITISSAVEVANRNGKRVLVDLIGIKNKLQRAKELETLGVHYLGVHTGTDEQTAGSTPLKDMKILCSNVNTPLVVAGGIDATLLKDILIFKPAIVVVGSKIVHSRDPFEAISTINQLLRKNDYEE